MSEQAERYARLHALFREARVLERAARAGWLEERCGTDAALRHEVEELLAALDDEGDSDAFSETGIARARGALEGLLSQPKPDAAWLPERVGSYRIERRIGAGGMGVVYQALQESPRRKVAIKLLHPQQETPERRKRFRQESEFLGRLHHPGIAQILEAGTYNVGHGEQPFFAMELVEGLEIRLYGERQRLDARGRLALLAEVADAVHHAHERGVIHRDLKPDNVLVDARGQPKVLDFGIARARDSSEVLSTLVTREGVLMGTLAYMAPEQLEGGVVTQRADVYALGVMTYELLTGRLPHEIGGLELPAALRVLESQPTVGLRVLAPELRGDVDTIVTRALVREPEKRYASAAAFAADIRRHLENRPIEARPPSRIYRLRKYARRNRAVVAILGVLLAAAVLSTFFGLRASRQRGLAERHAYQARMMTASLGIDTGVVSRAFLDAQPPRLRGWEWHYLGARLVPVLARLPADGVPMKGSPFLREGETVVFASSGGGLYWLDLESGELTRSVALGEHRLPDQIDAIPSSDDLALVGHTLPGQLEDMGTCWTVLLEADQREPTSIHAFQAVPHTLTVDGKRGVVFAADAETAFLLDVRSGRRVVERPLPQAISGRFGAGGTRLAVSGARGDLWILDGETLETQEHWTETYGSPSLSPDASHLATNGGQSGLVLWDLRTEPPLRKTLWTNSGRQGDLEFSPDGRLLASNDGDHLVRLWDVESGTLARVFAGLEDVPRVSAFTPDSSRLVTLDRSGEIRVFPTGDPFELRGHAGYVYAVAFVEPLGLLVTGGWDGQFGAPGALRFWDTRSGAAIAALGEPPRIVTTIAVMHDGQRIFAGLDQRTTKHMEILEVDLRTGGRRTVLEGPSTVHALSLSANGEHVHWADAQDGDGFLNSATLPEGRVLNRRFLHDETLGTRRSFAVETSPDGAWLAAALRLGDIALLRSDNFEEVASWTAHEGLINKLSFDAAGERLLSTSIDRTVRVWSVPDGARIAVLGGHASEVLSACFSPDGTRIVSGDRSGVIRVWDAESYAPVAELRGHENYVYQLDWSDDGQTIASASGDRTVRLWGTQTAAERERARRERERIVQHVEPVIRRLLAREEDTARVAAIIDAQPDWTPRERQVARQVLLGIALHAGE